MIETLFRNKKPNVAKLLTFGFKEKRDGYVYSAPLADGQFEMVVTVSQNGKVSTDVIDKLIGEKYILHLVTGAGGSFTGMIREQYESLLTAISESCFEKDIFKSKEAKQIQQYIEKKYNDKPEYLWPKFPTNAIFRRKDNAKWYALLLVVSKSKLGIENNDITEILDLRIDPQQVDSVADGKRYFSGYHMNKRSWITICLDGSVSIEEIISRIDASYEIAAKK